MGRKWEGKVGEMSGGWGVAADSRGGNVGMDVIPRFSVSAK